MARGRGKQNNRKRNFKNTKSRNAKFNSKSHKKRELKEYHHKGDDENNDSKRRKVVAKLPRKRQVSSSESEEEKDPFKQLLSTFTGSKWVVHDKTIGSDGSEDSDVDEGDVESPLKHQRDPTDGDEGGETVEDSDIKVVDSDLDEEVEVDELKEEEDDDDEEEEEETEQGDVDDALDPFTCHYRHDLGLSLLEAASSVPVAFQRHELNWSTLGRLVVELPTPKAEKKSAQVLSRITIDEEGEYAKPGAIPSRMDSVDWSKCFVKTQIHNNLSKANFANLQNEMQGAVPSPLTTLQRELFSIINNYQDLYYPERTLRNSEEVRFVYCLHAVNHILKTRTKILHHNAKLSRRDEVPDEFRDQGLVRPKVLIVVPFRSSALKLVKMIISILLSEKANVTNKKRFIDEYSGNEIFMPKKNPRPEDYEEMFAGNSDDDFRIGMNITNKSLKLYTNFYSADIIVASPLGLREIVGADGESDRDYDFLASIEVLVLDQAELFLMQNWDHLLHVMDHLHLQPREVHGTDFARVRSWAVNGWTRYYRQTLILSALQLPELNSLFNKRCHNYAGRVRVVNPVLNGSICQVVVQLPQVFHKVVVQSAADAIDGRFDFFTKKLLPQYKDSIMNHVLVYIPSYFDYVRLRNYFKREDLSFVQIFEYSKTAKIARARDMFYHDDAHFLLYTERAHFFHRFRLKGIRHILFYQPPSFPHFYSEMCNAMQEANQNPRSGNETNMTVAVLYTKYDGQQLAAIIGTERASRLVSSEKNVHMFMAGEGR